MNYTDNTDHAIEPGYHELVDLLTQLESAVVASAGEARHRRRESAPVDGPIQEIGAVQ